MRNTILVCSLALASFVGMFTATALAANQVTPEDGSLLDLLRPVYEAFMRGEKLYAGMLALIVVVALLKRYAPEKWGVSAFIHGDAGGALLTLVGSFGGAMATGLAGGEAPSWLMAKTATLIAVGAAGGYALIKKLFVEPLRNSAWFQTKAPAWVKGVLGMVFWIFDKPSPVALAEQEGKDAVESKPATGLNGVAGTPKDVP